MMQLGRNLLRAVGYGLLPRAIGLSLLPMLLLTALVWSLGHFYWEPALALVREWVTTWPWAEALRTFIPQSSWRLFNEVMAPVVVIGLVSPILILLCLWLVSVFSTGPLSRWVMRSRFPHLQNRSDWAWWQVVLTQLGWSFFAGLLLILSLPFWLIPPLGLICPALILGWLTQRIMLLDTISEWATHQEFKALLHAHRWQWLVMGLLSGFLGSLPSFLWSSALWFASLFLLLAPLVMWVYAWIFVFTVLWFAHQGLQELNELRAHNVTTPARPSE